MINGEEAVRRTTMTSYLGVVGAGMQAPFPMILYNRPSPRPGLVRMAKISTCKVVVTQNLQPGLFREWLDLGPSFYISHVSCGA